MYNKNAESFLVGEVRPGWLLGGAAAGEGAERERLSARVDQVKRVSWRLCGGCRVGGV